ncbi:hypothetical protein [Listeria booriae]|uniref:hypothetical protein n=1 Tax=Listeria booriae TaxID=1552123 RepID=UPI0016243684|nr:hypothetical protein [Listeria booriae]MBC2675950.1 DUF5011 domain-containing protein [Listeria booriae]
MNNKLIKIISAVIVLTFLAMGVSHPLTFAAESNTHYVHTTAVHDTEDIHTIHVPITKTERTEKLDLVIVQDLSRSFKSQFPEVSNRLQEAIDLLSPLLDRVSIVGFTSIKSSEAEASSLFNDARSVHQVGNKGRPDEYYNVLLKAPLQSDKNEAKQVFKDIEANDLYGNGTPTAFGVNEALKYYMEQQQTLNNQKTLFLVVTDGFPNGDINGNALIPSRSMIQLLGPDTGILKAFDNIKNNGFHSSFAMWQDEASLKKDLTEPVYTTFQNYLEEYMPQATSSEDFYFNMTNQKNTIEDFARTTKDIVQTHLNQELLAREKINDDATYVEDSAQIIDANGIQVSIPAPYTKPDVNDNMLSWQLDALPPGKYHISFQVATPKVDAAETQIEASDHVMYVNDSFHPIDSISPIAMDSIGNNLTSQIKVLENTVDVATPGVYNITYAVNSSETADKLPLIDFGELVFHDNSTQTLHPLDYEYTENGAYTEKKVTVTVLEKAVQAPEIDVLLPDNTQKTPSTTPTPSYPPEKIIANKFPTYAAEKIIANKFPAYAAEKAISNVSTIQSAPHSRNSPSLPLLGDNANWLVGLLGIALLTGLWFKIRKP